MEVICIKTTKKLVKNANYKVASFSNDNTRKSPYFRPSIRIYLNDSTLQSFPLESFKPSLGGDFQSINWVCPEYSQILEEREQTKIDKKLKHGDYVVPLYDSLKTLIKGRKYMVKEVKLGDTQWSGIQIKLDGSERFYSSWHFRKCTNQESREIGLKKLLDEKVDTEKVSRLKRKFDYLTNEEKITLLLRFVCQSATDRFRNNADIVSWAADKIGQTYNIKCEDFEMINNLTVQEIISILK